VSLLLNHQGLLRRLCLSCFTTCHGWLAVISNTIWGTRPKQHQEFSVCDPIVTIDLSAPKNKLKSYSYTTELVATLQFWIVVMDSWLQGCDASVLLQGNGTERSDPGNRSLGGFQVIDSAKRMLEIFCPGTVSCADVVALAARDAVAIVISLAVTIVPCWILCFFWSVIHLWSTWKQTGGPQLQIPTGRRDGRLSAAANVRPNIIDTTFTMNEMINIFTAKGLSLEDLVVLSGMW